MIEFVLFISWIIREILIYFCSFGLLHQVEKSFYPEYFYALRDEMHRR